MSCWVNKTNTNPEKWTSRHWPVLLAANSDRAAKAQQGPEEQGPLVAGRWQGWVGGLRWGAWGAGDAGMFLDGAGAVRAPCRGMSSARHSLRLAAAPNMPVLLGLQPL